ncbi:uncharacterized protein MONOS_302 [Monocercomonoides exilis]|uniref:uncharacterized protein n=1 Tax=Monocercomonoides exilis TaxID=2049356 RepID=UPI003559F1A2|nr:hypothetical protein MONOS_302 [Monocercomonoides exilis]|eukprot:MONOS_302.1-p1 / transcript=MONOS_302.1 / gene=MONOS_302 / organism=Monocercomonoides_exilis_PA203 / gene_product=unspecified product / transcript_product=unspecified product / location=Mono_scaffold00005:81235-82079(+) / protein_length=182 / sequence_SO=supercontig / SO=protein_coding / is_pseudo=false
MRKFFILLSAKCASNNTYGNSSQSASAMPHSASIQKRELSPIIIHTSFVVGMPPNPKRIAALSSSSSADATECTKNIPRIRFASASEDGTVKIHTHSAPLSQEHLCKDWDVAEIATRSPAFKVRFCESERQVLVAAGTDSDSVWEETEAGKWARFTAIKASEEKREDQKVEENEKAKEELA